MDTYVKTPSMGFAEALKTCFKKYASFSGRARRSEFWWFSVLNCLLSAAIYGVFIWKLAKIGTMEAQVREVMFDEEKLNALQVQAEQFDSMFFLVLVALGVVMLLLVLPSLAVAVRRLHDTGRSGWLLLAMIIPLVNIVMGVVLLVYYLQDSEPRPNEFGPSPKYKDPSNPPV